MLFVMKQDLNVSEKLNNREPACGDIKTSGNDVVVSMCLPYFYIKVVEGNPLKESTTECPGDPEEIVEPDHPI